MWNESKFYAHVEYLLSIKKGAPYSQKIVRAIKVLNYDKDDLNEEVIAIMCQDSYVRAFDNEVDQLEFFNDRYHDAEIKFNRIKK